MNLKNLTLPELAETLKELHEPAFRAKQVYAGSTRVSGATRK